MDGPGPDAGRGAPEAGRGRSTSRRPAVRGIVALAALLVVVVAGGVLLLARPWAAGGPAGATGSPGATPTGATVGSSPGAGTSVTTGAAGSPAESPGESPGDLLDQPIESAPPRGPDLTARENTRRGTDRWVLALDGKGDAEGYFDDVSVAPGRSVGLHIRSTGSQPAI